MFFLVSKLLAFFTLPSNLAIALAMAGTALLFTRFARAGRRILVLTCVLFLLFGISPLGRVMMLALENRFPAWDASRGAPAGFIILGGTINADISIARKTAGISGSAERLTVIPALIARYPGAKIIFSSGNASIFPGGPSEADNVGPLLRDFGVPPEKVIIENESRNTAENAAFSKRVANPRPGERWVVITSAFHMPRSIGCFRAVGFDVEAYPVDYRTTGLDSTDVFQSFGNGFSFVDVATREFIGMLTYWMTGRLSEPFPAPHQVSSIAR